MNEAITLNPKAANPIQVSEKEQSIIKDKKPTATKPLIIEEREEIAAIKVNPAKTIEVQEVMEQVIIENKPKATKALVIEEREDIALLQPKTAKKIIDNKEDGEEVIRINEKPILTAPLIVEDHETIERIPSIKEIKPIEETEIAMAPVIENKIALTPALVIEEREEIASIESKQIEISLNEDSLVQQPILEIKPNTTLPLEIAEVKRDSTPELIRKNVEMVIITESDNDLQIAVSPAPKYDEPTINEVSANYMTFKHNSTAVEIGRAHV